MRKQQQMQQRKLINEPCLNKTFRKKICSTTEHVLAVRNFVTFLCSLLFTFQQRSSDTYYDWKKYVFGAWDSTITNFSCFKLYTCISHFIKPNHHDDYLRHDSSHRTKSNSREGCWATVDSPLFISLSYGGALEWSFFVNLSHTRKNTSADYGRRKMFLHMW